MPRHIARLQNASLHEFRPFLTGSQPAIITGAVLGWSDSGWDLDRLQKLCGRRTLFPECAQKDNGHVKVHMPSDYLWGSLVATGNISHLLPTISHLMDAQAQGDGWRMEGLLANGMPTTGDELYLHDAPLAHYCPAALAELRAPRYFTADMRLQGMAPVDVAASASADSDDCSAWRASHPSLFLGAATSRTGLHRDGDGSRFWMAVLRGTKRFRLIDPGAARRLREAKPTACDRSERHSLRAAQPAKEPDPELVLELCPGWDMDLFAPGAEDAMAGETLWEGTVGPGELIFIPERWAHQVVNDSPTMAVSYNFVDEYSLGGHVQLLLDRLGAAVARRASESESAAATRAALIFRMQALAFAIEEGRLPAHASSEQADDVGDISWEQFFSLNMPPEDVDHEQRMAAWLQGGGIGAFLSAHRQDPAHSSLRALDDMELRRRRRTHAEQVLGSSCPPEH